MKRGRMRQLSKGKQNFLHKALVEVDVKVCKAFYEPMPLEQQVSSTSISLVFWSVHNTVFKTTKK